MADRPPVMAKSGRNGAGKHILASISFLRGRLDRKSIICAFGLIKKLFPLKNASMTMQNYLMYLQNFFLKLAGKTWMSPGNSGELRQEWTRAV